jgi:uridine kinase
MSGPRQSTLKQKAIEVLTMASFDYGIRASSEQRDNYGAVWARDAAVAGLAILTSEVKQLYSPLKQSIVQLSKAASEAGQIPSNILINNLGEVQSVSFGGPVGRVDASFWWIVAAVILAQKDDDLSFKDLVYKQCELIFKVADTWEFNGKGLMYVPMSSNWADEFVTSGYVLYDQVLRYWALQLAGNFFKRDDWNLKASNIKVCIKQHYLLEAELNESLFTGAQQRSLLNFDISKHFIASFTPGNRVEKFDAWSIALLLLLDIPSTASKQKINSALLEVFEQAGHTGIPAFWPIITAADPLFQQLEYNYNYSFKNKPGHFHNGGIWPVVNGFLVAGLKTAGLDETAQKLMDGLEQKLSSNLEEKPFPEYFDYYNGTPNGVANLCFSASGYLLATVANQQNAEFINKLLPHRKNEKNFLLQLKPSVKQIVNYLSINPHLITVIAIAGESGSGKTTLTQLFREELIEMGFNVLVLHQDDYFKLPPIKNHKARIEDFSVIGPQEVRLSMLDEHLSLIKNRQKSTLEVPHMNWITDVEETVTVNAEGVNVVLVDGTYTSLLNQADLKIFIDTSYEHTRQNRINRNRETITPFIERVLNKEMEIIRKHQEHVDLVLDKKFTMIQG